MANQDDRGDLRNAGDATGAIVVMQCPAGRWWLCALLGVVMIAAGVFVLFHVMAGSIVSAIFFGAALAVAGAFQIVHGFSSRDWGGVALSIAVGILILIAGAILMASPLATSLGLTLAFAATAIVAGGVRLMMAWRHWGDYGPVLVASGLVGILTGAVVLLGFPWSGLVVPGLLLGIDLIIHGGWWLALGAWVRRPAAGATGSMASVAR
jgi:uncharacterized membrane protein HdeD (DUF308 family)